MTQATDDVNGGPDLHYSDGIAAARTMLALEGNAAQLSYIAFVSQVRNQATGATGHIHWFTYTEDPVGIPGKYRDGTLATIAARMPGRLKVGKRVTS